MRLNTSADHGLRLIVGHVTHNSAKVWGRGDEENSVMFLKATDAQGNASQAVLRLNAEDGYTGTVDLTKLKKSTDYSLDVSYGPTPECPPEDRHHRDAGQFETFPTPQESEPFTVILGSCNFHGFGPFRNNDRAAEKVAEVAAGADLVIHAGDQVYADKAPISFTVNEFRNAYLGTWEDPGLKRVLSSQANYMVPDDHEVVNGYALDGELTTLQRTLLWARGHHKPAREQYEEMAANGIQAFTEFQKSHNPKTFGEDANYYTFAHGQHQFFAMDTRFERHDGERRLIGPEQKEALFGWLTEHRDQPKFIVTAGPFVTGIGAEDETWTRPEFKRQRDEIIDFLAQEKLDNVVFLAGDIHGSCHSELTITTKDGNDLVIHELVSSPINASKMVAERAFSPGSSDITSEGITYRSKLDPDSVVAGGILPTIGNSNIMKFHVDGDDIHYEIYRTRKDDGQPFRQGNFKI